MNEKPTKPEEATVTRFNADADDRASERAWRSEPEVIEEAHNRHPSRNPEVFARIQALRASRLSPVELVPVEEPETPDEPA